MSFNQFAPSAPVENGMNHALESMLEVQEREAAEAAAKATREETPTCAGLPQYLTPQSLVAYCDTRLTSLDSQMQTIFNQQQTSAASETALSSLASALNDLPQPGANAGSNPTVSVSVRRFDQLQNAYDAAIAAAGGPKTTLGKSLEGDLKRLSADFPVSEFGMSGDANKTYPIPESTISNLSQNVKTYASNLNSDSQISMINLQSMMSQQQTAVELSTNLLQTLSQTANTIASNMKVG